MIKCLLQLIDFALPLFLAVTDLLLGLILHLLVVVLQLLQLLILKSLVLQLEVKNVRDVSNHYGQLHHCAELVFHELLLDI